MKYLYREHIEVEKAFLVFSLLKNNGYIPLERPKLNQNNCFYESQVEFEGTIDKGLLTKINNIPGVSLLIAA